MDKRLYLFFDTETTGLPIDYNAPSTDLSNWPRLVQISWIVSDDNRIIVSKNNHIIKPIDFVIPKDVADLHKITTERAIEFGENIKDVLHLFWADVQNANYIIGHNVSFDENVVESEFFRMGENNIFSFKHSICTKIASTDYCKIPNKWKSREYKWPKLSELYFILFGKDMVDAHDSESDVQATFECFWKLKDLGIISGLEIDEGVKPIYKEYTSSNSLNFTVFAFNAAYYGGYIEPTIGLNLLEQDWNLFWEDNEPQTLLFGSDNKVHLMNKGKGILGNYELKNRTSILLSFGEECYYLHCVYYNKEIIIFKFDQSNNHIILSRKDIVFHSVGEIRGYLTNAKRNIDLEREEKRKCKAIEVENHVKTLIEDICRAGVEASDERVVSIKRKLQELSYIVGTQEAAKYQLYVDNAVKDNQELRAKIAEEIKKEQEEKKKQKEIKKERYMKWIAIFAISILFISVWVFALFLHLNDKWEECKNLLLWSGLISFLGILPSFYFKKAKVIFVYIFFSCLTIISCLVYDDDWHKFRDCFGSLEYCDKYLSETKFHLFDSPTKDFIEMEINYSYDLQELNHYINNSIYGYYVEEAAKQLNYVSDILCRQAETMGDWRYIIYNAPQEYKIEAEKNYARLDSFVWDDEELAYKNAKSLNTIEAYDKYLSRNFNNNHRLEIEKLKSDYIKFKKSFNLK